MREDQSPVKVTSKAGKKRQGESNYSEKGRSEDKAKFLISMPHKYDYDSEFKREFEF